MGLRLCMVCGIFLIFSGLSFCVLGLCSGSEDALGPSRPVSTAGSRCVVCGLMFSPTSPAEGAPDLFISAGEAAVSNSSGYLFGRLYTALAALCSLTCGPMCARPHASWLRTTRLLWAQTYYETGWGRLHLGGQFFSFFFQCRGVHCFVNHLCTALIRVLYYMCTQSVLHAQFSFLFSCFCSYVIFFPM